MTMALYLKHESNLINGYRAMTSDGRMDRQTDDNTKTISLCLRQAIIKKKESIL